ncbi:MAG: patatin-like phospholipase family protein [Patescibacteria group bacterium]
MKERKKIGLALGSGAVRGLAHIGVIKALTKHGIPIDYIAGSSIGAWVGAHYALYMDIRKTEEFTVGKKKEKLLSFLEPSMSGGFIGGEKIEILLDDWLGISYFKDTKIPIRIIATDLVGGEPVIFDRGRLGFATRASMAIPGLFVPVKFEDKILVDGGVSNPVPDDVVKAMGADIVIAVNLDNFQEQDAFTDADLNLNRVAIRSSEIMRHYLAKYSMKDSDIIIQPKLKRYSSWREYFMKDVGGEIAKIGEQEAEKAIPQIIKLMGS